MDESSKVYIRKDSAGRIIAIDGGYPVHNIRDFTDWILIDEGYGDRYNLCQSNYLPSPLLTDDGICRWKWENKRCVLRTDGEIDADRAAMPKPPLSDIEKLEAKIAAQNELLDFYENCIAEMAEIVYA